MNDVFDTMKESMEGVHMHTPVERIVAAGRARRRRKVTAIAAGATVAGGLSLVVATGGPQVNAPPAGVHVQLAAFSVDSNTDGTVTVKLTKEQTLDPATLQNALAQAGIPADIRINEFCNSPVDIPGFDKVMSDNKEENGRVVMTIDPAAMPEGTKIIAGIRTPDYKPDDPSRLGAVFGLARTGDTLQCSTELPR
ncbi:hypothetical protein ETD86_44495 [Nonomuraea turkmeniaca]|uniref:Uncharacterized protein n=1 Tax=Nonomuraea turkmeniaca TaxID=103838 RepID=A0A5S4EZY5_9ACTN|nr:hypothetical protein [Nonomuraea turkmeniaca]TMR09215.1 hypothetical protein ETD86_44495 [Nonomuraea turkmeniaca]